MISRRMFLTTLAATPFFARPALAASPDIFAEGGIAIRGADPVAYFNVQDEVTGLAEFALMWRGATWHFANDTNRALFEADPMAYAPQYGGYCAYAASQGYVAPIDPSAWTVHDGKLYLNFSRRVRRIWARDIPGNIALADANWPDILQA